MNRIGEAQFELGVGDEVLENFGRAAAVVFSGDVGIGVLHAVFRVPAVIKPFSVWPIPPVGRIPVLMRPVGVADVVVGDHVSDEVIDVQDRFDRRVVRLVAHVGAAEIKHGIVGGGGAGNHGAGAVFHRIVFAIVATEVLGGKIVVRALVQFRHAPEDAVDVEQAVLAFGGQAAHQVLQVRWKLVPCVLSASRLTRSGTRSRVVVPHVVETVVEDQGIEAVAAVFPKDREAQVGGEFQTHRELVGLPSAGARAANDAHRSIDLESLGEVRLGEARVRIEILDRSWPINALAGNVDTAAAKHLVPIHRQRDGRHA